MKILQLTTWFTFEVHDNVDPKNLFINVESGDNPFEDVLSLCDWRNSRKYTLDAKLKEYETVLIQDLTNDKDYDPT
jgi:hypothetical protein